MYTYISKATKDINHFKYINIGSSWAWSAFAGMHQDQKLFNYADVWNIPYYDLSMPGRTNEILIKNLEIFLKKNPTDKPIIWFWPEISNIGWQQIHDKDDWKERYQSFVMQDLEIIDNIGNKILIIGSHGDPNTMLRSKSKKNFKNITFADTSIQQFIGEYCDSNYTDAYFGFECAWCWINASKNHSKSLVNSVYEGLEVWRSWEEKLMFVGMAHPTEKAVELYAKKHENFVKTWLQSQVNIDIK